ncbi:MAG: hypothetical protein QOF98_1013 [Streptomyces sp.]|nr:hypothetical protein [Streptomyces sp.]
MPWVREFELPDLGEGLAGAEVARWLVEVGDMIVVDQPLVEVETAKAMVEVPCPFAGVVTQIHAGAGQTIPVGHPLVSVTVEDLEEVEEVTDAAGPGGGTGAPRPPRTPGSNGGDRAASGGDRDNPDDPDGERAGASGNVLVGYGTSGPPRRRGRPQPAMAGAPVRVISPVVRRLARQYGVDVRYVRGSGPDGLILRADVEREIAARPPAPRPAAPPDTVSPDISSPDTVSPDTSSPDTSSPDREPADERIPVRGVRAAAAAKFTRSRTEIPDATCWVDADATELVAARQLLGLGLLPLLARICLTALARYPQFNAEVDAARGEVVRKREVHLGFAAQSDRGLVVPVVHRAHTRSASGLHDELSRLTEAARTGGLTPGELSRGTFTLNNYGVFGVDGSTPILNAPEAAMLGVGRITDKPWVHHGELAVRKVVQLSFTFDHRVCDGAEAGGFLRHVADRVEQPLLLLRDL